MALWTPSDRNQPAAKPFAVGPTPSPPPVAVPIVPNVFNLPQVTDGELRRYADLVYRRTGIRIPPQKKTLLSNRLRRRLRETGLSSYSAYYDYLTKLPPHHPEWDAFLQEITTHETYLFRDEVQWRWFQQQFLPQIMATRTGPAKSLRIWSAACSTGDEAFTAACCIAATLPDLRSWRITTLGTDIGIGAIEQARSAVFGERAMRLVPADYKNRFFDKQPNASVWRAKPILTHMVSFRRHNLLEPLQERPFDLIFLKNVLIYFDTASKQQVLKHVTKVLRPKGYLMVGAAEGVGDLLRDMRRVQSWLYQLPDDHRGETRGTVGQRTSLPTAGLAQM